MTMTMNMTMSTNVKKFKFNTNDFDEIGRSVGPRLVKILLRSLETFLTKVIVNDDVNDVNQHEYKVILTRLL